MPYNLNKSDGTQLTIIPDGGLDTTTSLDLPGPNYVGYGQKLNENLVYLLENFCANTAPAGLNLQGQLWFDQYNQKLNVFTQQGYSPVSGIINSSTQPLTGHDGDIWFNQVTEQLYIYDVGAWKQIGPIYTKAMGVSGAIPDTVIASGTGQPHNIIRLQNGNKLIAIISYDANFVPATPIDGFPRIYTGITFNTEINPTINSNLTGAVTGSLTGTVNGSLHGDVLGNVTGNVTGNLVGGVTGNLTGDVTGNVTGTNGSFTNLNTTLLTATGGTAIGLANVSSTNAYISAANIVSLVTNSIVSSNIQASTGTVTGLTNFSAITGNIVNLSSSNVNITTGTVTGLTNLTSLTGNIVNLTSSNVRATGGNLTNITSLSGTNLVSTNFNTGNALITGGAITGLTNLTATSLAATNFNTGNALITGGGVYNVVGANITVTGANLITSVTTTANASTSNTAIASTAFVHAVVPRGVIWMWNSTAATIPYGFQLCDGTNGTPDLRDRFVVGAGTSYNPADTGGSNSVTLNSNTVPSHTHTATSTSTFTGVALPGHTHSGTTDNKALTGDFDVAAQSGYAAGVFSQATSYSGNGADPHTNFRIHMATCR
jgi:hypothetical protein